MGFDQMHPATYLNGERWKDELPVEEAPKQKKSVPDWYKSNEGTDKMARELGMAARGGETYFNFRLRMLDEIRRREGVTQ